MVSNNQVCYLRFSWLEPELPKPPDTKKRECHEKEKRYVKQISDRAHLWLAT